MSYLLVSQVSFFAVSFLANLVKCQERQAPPTQGVAVYSTSGAGRSAATTERKGEFGDRKGTCSCRFGSRPFPRKLGETLPGCKGSCKPYPRSNTATKTSVETTGGEGKARRSEESAEHEACGLSPVRVWPEGITAEEHRIALKIINSNTRRSPCRSSCRASPPIPCDPAAPKGGTSCLPSPSAAPP